MTTAVANDRAAELFQLLIEGDEQACRDLIFRACRYEHATNIEICDELAKVFHRIGDAWECAELSIYREHIASQIGHRLLLDLRSHRPKQEVDAPKAIGCTPESDPYLLPTLMVELVLREQGWQADSLGTNLPLELLEAALDEIEPDLCWVSVSFINSLPRLQEQLTRLGELSSRRGVKLICGGRAINDQVLSGIENLDYLADLDSLRHLRL